MTETWPQMSPKQGRALARFLHELRPDWDVAGIDAQLGYARGLGSAPDLAIAAIRAASSSRNRTPAAIGHQGGEHWQQTTPATPTRPRGPSREDQCAYCGQGRTRCRQLYTGDHEFEPHVPHDAVGVDQTTGELIELPANTARVQQVRASITRREPA